MFLTDVVVELGYATREQVDAVIERARVAGRLADELMLEERLLNSEQLARATAERYGLDHIDLSAFHVDMGAANLLSVSSARRYQAVPVGYVDKDTLLARDGRSGERARDRRHPDDHRPQLPDGGRGADDVEALITRLNSLETRGHRGRRRGRGRGGARRGHRAARVGRRRPGHQARLLDPRPGGDRGRLRHPLRAGRGGDAGPLPRRRRALRGSAGAEADGRRRRLAGEDHEQPRHRREARPAGRARHRQRRGSQGRPAGHDPADPARRGRDDPHPRQGPCAALARRPRHGRDGPRVVRGRRSPAPMARSSSPGRPARASRPRSTRRSRS